MKIKSGLKDMTGAEDFVRVNGIKMFPKRVRVLQILAQPDAFAMPSGAIPYEFQKDRGGRLDSEMAQIFKNKGWIDQCKPPKSAYGIVYVWRITPLGREALERLP